MKDSQLYIGLMSGTSADGIDAALVEFKADKMHLVDFISPTLPDNLKQELLTINESPQIHLEQLSQLSFDIAQQFSLAALQLLKQNQLSADKLSAIGSHGQTIYHAPSIPMSLQIGHPAIIAKTTKIDTVADFRVDDMALGGQGAPFAPAFHQVLFQQEMPCFIVNIGGIANISYLPGSNSPNQAPQGHDSGPGNALMDEICQASFGKPYDQNGDLAAQGNINQPLLKHLFSHPYFSQTAPKSTGRETFNGTWLQQQLELNNERLSAEDLLATLCELTALSISTEIQSLLLQQPEQSPDRTPVWIVGGGAYNTTLIQRIQSHLPECTIHSSESMGINPNAIEAMMCAWLAKQRIEQHPVALSQVTGASRDAILGGLWLA